ncbi:MAG: metallophosphoesterase [Saprospiraceae bacterium]
MNFVQNLLLLYVFLDIYTFFGLKSLFPKGKQRILFSIAYWLVSAYVYFCWSALWKVLFSGNFFGNTSANFELGLVLTFLVTKLVFVIVTSLQDFGRFAYGIGSFIKRKVNDTTQEVGTKFFPSRRRFINLAAAGLAAIPFGTMLYGITRGKYAYTVNRVKLSFPNLPAAFSGMKVVQISDIHAGSLDSPEDVLRGVNLINQEEPDLILFTGDMVNSDKDEVNDYIDIFKQLNAKLGKFSVLGNHDYYGDPDPESAPTMHKSYWADFENKFKQMGFNLLRNANARVEKDGESICICGVENWGKGRYFPKLADLGKTFTGTTEEDFCIMLSHDPSHWDEKLLPHSRHIPLTLSGHTHGFQFGIKMPGFKWSPAQYRYPRWYGLYEEAKQYLYVNRGFGYLAFPGRIGMWPEITVIELERA